MCVLFSVSHVILTRFMIGSYAASVAFNPLTVVHLVFSKKKHKTKHFAVCNFALNGALDRLTYSINKKLTTFD